MSLELGVLEKEDNSQFVYCYFFNQCYNEVGL